MIPSFLNDFALVASSPGVANNVTAACPKMQDESQTYTLLVAKNKFSDQRTLDGLTAMISSITLSSSRTTTTDLPESTLIDGKDLDCM